MITHFPYGCLNLEDCVRFLDRLGPNGDIPKHVVDKMRAERATVSAFHLTPDGFISYLRFLQTEIISSSASEEVRRWARRGLDRVISSVQNHFSFDKTLPPGTVRMNHLRTFLPTYMLVCYGNREEEPLLNPRSVIERVQQAINRELAQQFISGPQSSTMIRIKGSRGLPEGSVRRPLGSVRTPFWFSKNPMLFDCISYDNGLVASNDHYGEVYWAGVAGSITTLSGIPIPDSTNSLTITGTLLREVPDLSRLSTLTTLNVSENRLTSLPPSLLQLPRLNDVIANANLIDSVVALRGCRFRLIYSDNPASRIVARVDTGWGNTLALIFGEDARLLLVNQEPDVWSLDISSLGMAVGTEFAFYFVLIKVDGTEVVEPTLRQITIGETPGEFVVNFGW